MPRITALHMLRSTMKTVSAPASRSFRGSLPHPTHPLCTLRVRRHRRLTQHSLPGGLLDLTWAGLAPADRASLAWRLPVAVGTRVSLRAPRTEPYVRLARIPLGPHPSLHQLRRGLLRFVRRLPSYYGGVRLLGSVHHRLRLLTFPMRTIVLGTHSTPMARPETSQLPMRSF